MIDPRKAARLADRSRMRQGRTQTVTLVYVRPNATDYQPAELVWQHQVETRPQDTIEEPVTTVDVIAEFPLQIDPRQVTYAAETSNATAAGVAAAPKYEIVSRRQAGIVPNRWIVHLRRMR